MDNLIFYIYIIYPFLLPFFFPSLAVKETERRMEESQIAGSILTGTDKLAE
jgi:hypothetical protein